MLPDLGVLIHSSVPSHGHKINVKLKLNECKNLHLRLLSPHDPRQKGCSLSAMLSGPRGCRQASPGPAPLCLACRLHFSGPWPGLSLRRASSGPFPIPILVLVLVCWSLARPAALPIHGARGCPVLSRAVALRPRSSVLRLSFVLLVYPSDR